MNLFVNVFMSAAPDDFPACNNQVLRILTRTSDLEVAEVRSQKHRRPAKFPETERHE